jgi:hypothetical protein
MNNKFLSTGLMRLLAFVLFSAASAGPRTIVKDHHLFLTLVIKQ